MLTVGGGAAPEYQCDECLVEVDLPGDKTEQALTFAVDGQERVFDVADSDGGLRC